jgi:hypothetical protein
VSTLFESVATLIEDALFGLIGLVAEAAPASGESPAGKDLLASPRDEIPLAS